MGRVRDMNLDPRVGSGFETWILTRGLGPGMEKPDSLPFLVLTFEVYL